MSDDPFYAPGRKPHQERVVIVPGQHVWTLQKGPGTVRFELREDEHGVEARFRDGDFYASRRFLTRGEAEQHAAGVRRDLERDGWQ